MALREYEEKYEKAMREYDLKTDFSEKARVLKYMERSRGDLFLARLLMKISADASVKNALVISANYSCFPWVIVAGYYAMYQAATAAIAKKGMKAKSHVATVAALAKHYAMGGKLAQQLEEAYIVHLDATRITRMNAQYEVTLSFSENEAQRTIDTAQEFIDKINEILQS